MSTSNGSNGQSPASNGHLNGASTNGLPKPVKTRHPLHDANGDFKVGNPGGPGRPKGSMDLMQICRREAKKSGVNLELLVWGALQGIATRAAKGDAAAAREFLNRTCGPVERGVEINVGVDARTAIQAGPAAPAAGDLGDYIAKLNKIAADQGLLRGQTARQVMDDAVSEAAEIEGLLG